MLRAATVPHARPQAAVRCRLRRACVAGVLALAGCAGLPPPVERPDTHALPAAGTALDRLVQEAAPDAQRSGLRPLINGAEAFDALAALIDRAERSLDLQYYLVRGDGRLPSVRPRGAMRTSRSGRAAPEQPTCPPASRPHRE